MTKADECGEVQEMREVQTAAMDPRTTSIASRVTSD
jgi:hypothetical protein